MENDKGRKKMGMREEKIVYFDNVIHVWAKIMHF